MKNIEKFYKTKDYLLASVLDCLGVKLDKVQWEDNSLHFFFEDYYDCEQIIDNYYRGELKVNPKSLFDSSRNIRTMIFNKKFN